jgi:hypothetical protein
LCVDQWSRIDADLDLNRIAERMFKGTKYESVWRQFTNPTQID